jgi:hypothetical protein
MRDSWLDVVDFVLRPARPHLERCQQERESHVAAHRLFSEERSRAIANCQQRIEDARAVVFAANDGVISSLMTQLEREWRLLSRRDPEAGMMDLWARIAPHAWSDRKRWRCTDADPAKQLDAAVALAADVDGVEAAESAIDSLRVALAPWGAAIGAPIRWRAFAHDSDPTTELLAGARRAAVLACSRSSESFDLHHAEHLEREVHDAVLARLPERPLLARAIGGAAFVDSVWRAASLGERPNPAAPLRALWRAGYALSSSDASGVTIELPPL